MCQDNGIRHLLTAPYSPTTTGKVERFHRTLRDEWVRPNHRRFESIVEAQATLAAWVEHYNTERPHQSLGQEPPVERFRLARARDDVVDPKDLPEPVGISGRFSPGADAQHPGYRLVLLGCRCAALLVPCACCSTQRSKAFAKTLLFDRRRRSGQACSPCRSDLLETNLAEET